MLTFMLLAVLQGPASPSFMAVRDSVVALLDVRIIDGTGAPAREHQTLILQGGRIAAMGDRATTPVPAGARELLLTGRSVLPGWVMLHEHLFYVAGDGAYPTHSVSFPRLYLAGGATTIRTAGNMGGYTDLNIKRMIDAGQIPGPDIEVTAPYLNGPGLPIPGVKALRNADDAKRMVEYWAAEGATSFKAYMQISRSELGAAIKAAHSRGLKVTGHLCSVTYREAADLGIDNLEHGFFAATDFVTEKEPDRCPGAVAGRQTMASQDPSSPAVQEWLTHLVSRGVAITSTLTVMEARVPGQPKAPPGALESMLPQAREQYERTWARINTDSIGRDAIEYRRLAALEREFVRLGGLLVVGTDPTGYGGVVPGYANQRAVELLVEAGFTPLEAIRIATLNGASYLGIKVGTGSVTLGKDADLIIVTGAPDERIGDVRNVELVFKRGIGYDSPAMFASVKGLVGWK